jgi:hypothetical protein
MQVTQNIFNTQLPAIIFAVIGLFIAGRMPLFRDDRRQVAHRK